MTKIKHALFIVVVALFVFTQKSKAQSNTLYFMDGLHQSIYLNPAYQSSCNVFLGLPAISGINLDVANTGFSYKDFIHPGTGDSLVIDIESMKDQLGNSNYIMLSNVVPVLGLGFWIKDYYFTFDISNKTKFRMSYPSQLLKLTEGNADYLGSDNPLEIKDFGPDLLNYEEFAFGLSKRLTHRLFVGARAKLLFGSASIESKRSNLSITTDESSYAIDIESEFDYNISGPVQVLTDSTGKFDGIELNEEIGVSDFINTSNVGVAIDLGATYQFSDKLKFYGSITDLGFIHWKANTVNLKANGSFNFTGLNLDSIADTDFSEMDGLLDSLMNLVDFVQTNDPFSTFLSTNIYLGASYDIGNFMNFGLLSRTTFYDRKAHQAFTLSANFKPVKWFSGTLSYSVANRSFNNLGVGIAVKGGPFEFYFLSDNLNAAFWPKGSRAVGFQLGINLNFGCGKRDDFSIINNKKLIKDIDFM